MKIETKLDVLPFGFTSWLELYISTKARIVTAVENNESTIPYLVQDIDFETNYVLHVTTICHNTLKEIEAIKVNSISCDLLNVALKLLMQHKPNLASKLDVNKLNNLITALK